MSVQDVRMALLALSRCGDDLRGGDWSDIQDWHADVVAYVRAALGDGPADDVANRLRCTRGATQAEKEYNSVGFITDWLGTQVIGLTEAKIVPGFDGTVPAPVIVVPEPEVIPPPVVDVIVEPEPEDEDGDTGPKIGPAIPAADSAAAAERGKRA